MTQIIQKEARKKEINNRRHVYPVSFTSPRGNTVQKLPSSWTAGKMHSGVKKRRTGAEDSNPTPVRSNATTLHARNNAGVKERKIVLQSKCWRTPQTPCYAAKTEERKKFLSCFLAFLFNILLSTTEIRRRRSVRHRRLDHSKKARQRLDHRSLYTLGFHPSRSSLSWAALRSAC